MRTVILAGGLGSRLSEETSLRPKPMVGIGGIPMIVHIMRIYDSFGFNEFVVACGHLSHIIKDYFLKLNHMESDLTISLRDGTCTATNSEPLDWTVSLVDTGDGTMTGGRLLQLRDWLSGGTFMCTYGDGVADINIQALLEFHKSHGRLATVTSVCPPIRFGALSLDGDEVVKFGEVDAHSENRINGGFFVLEPAVLDYIEGDDTPFEGTPLRELARDGQLMGYRHDGFWHPMDTLRDQRHLDQLWSSGNAPWKLWS
jgi:glucose-1-phosphate cytidylyltransferase